MFSPPDSGAQVSAPGLNPHPVLRVDAAGEVVYRNEAAQRLADQYDLSLSQLLPARHQELIRESLEFPNQELSAQQSQHDELVVRWFYKAHPEGKEVFLYGTDMTPQLEALEELDIKRRYQTLFRQSRDAVYITDENGYFLDVNPAMCQMLGYSSEQLLGMTASELYQDIGDHRALLQELHREGAIKDFEATLETRTGTPLHCELTTTVQRNAEGKILGYQGIIHDVTEERHLSSFLTSTLEATADALLAVDLDGEVRYFNQQYCELWNIPAEVVEASSWSDLIEHAARQLTAPSATQMKEAARQMRRDVDYRAENIAHFKSGRQIRRYIRPRMIDGQIRGWVLSFTDITQFKKMEERLEYLAFHDPLTDLENRRLLEKRGEKAIALADRQEHRVGLLFIDLDGFKRVNDHFGHPTGDEVLCRIASRMRETLREADSLARIGGDEFAVLLPQIEGLEEVEVATERLQECVTRPIQIHADQHIDMAISIGVALYPDHAQDFKQLLHRADQAMYINKKQEVDVFSVYDGPGGPEQLDGRD